jgi:hypothetical protein
MEDIKKTINTEETTRKHIALMSLINEIEKRMSLSELVFLSMNIIVFLFTIFFVSSLMNKSHYNLTPIHSLFIFFCLVIGMSICTYWLASSMRLQLKLKLRYFQARFMERKMDCSGECFISDESTFFDPKINEIESADKKETLYYPTSGALRMDGFIGSAKPRHLSLLMPFMFFIIYSTIFIWLITKFLS